ncbi:hypothetical protein FOL47_007865 [Perkinsus chesapeaki]|uniref:Uncharacterized protein n=1 Tax=Perkinsus chesapeaki TaxID=330153 RepID=A0A7J6LHI6_PERCH|nr:hypothetical protein FOL47_007865 [Perkinsus chesapeaki]
MRLTGYLYLSYSSLALVQYAELDFQGFVKKYNKVYKSPEEYQAAMDAFAQSVKEIEEVRRNGAVEHEVGINEHSDIPQEQFNKVMTCMSQAANRRLEIGNNEGSGQSDVPNGTNVGDLPTDVDWEAAGALGPVRDQVAMLRSCGCCYAISSVAVMESRFKIQSGISKVVPFSVQQIVDCSTMNNGCGGGRSEYVYDYARKQGMVKASSYPYVAKDGTCKTTLVTNPQKQCIKAGDIAHVYLTRPANELFMMYAVAQGPVGVTLHAGAPALRKYKSGIITAKACGDGNINHQVTIVGYGTSTTGIPYWKIMNSWGKSWGMKGFAYIERTGAAIPRGACGILTNQSQYPNFGSSIKSSPCIKP